MANYSFADVVKSANNEQCSHFFKKVKSANKMYYFTAYRMISYWNEENFSHVIGCTPKKLVVWQSGRFKFVAAPAWRPALLQCFRTVPSLLSSDTSICQVHPLRLSVMSVCHVHLRCPSVTSVHYVCLSYPSVRHICPSVMSVHHVCPSRLSVMLSVIFVHHVCPFGSVWKFIQFTLYFLGLLTQP